ncbi:Methyltransferase 24 [uncultured delta proteobacterium]|uniref:Methyltransferase 24 n=1 Tax=uncultured delta proteobacterium TaxID=34034 RepID=A0A212KH68_9DELT|nr:Methyltransferase 24 [uncultured delta proteobacterium]
MSKWPKRLPELTAEQERISAEFMAAHLDAMQTKWYGFVEGFNHKYPLRSFSPGCRTLELGAGLAAHLKYERYTEQEYYCNELLPELCKRIKMDYPGVNVVPGDCQKGFLQFEDGFFDRILAIHVLEHLPNLPAAVREAYRLLRAGGQFSVVIPCEGGLATRIARNISARRHFEKRYGQSYDWFIQSQHINFPEEILEELFLYFAPIHNRWFPSVFPSVSFNLFLGMTLVKRGEGILA